MVLLLMLSWLLPVFADQQCLDHGACAAQCAASLRVCIADCSPPPLEQIEEEKDMAGILHVREVIAEVVENCDLPFEEKVHDINSAVGVRHVLTTIQCNSSEETALPLHLSSVDTNGDNLITGEEMMVVFRDMGSTMSDSELMTLVGLSDLGADAMVNLEEMKVQMGARLVWFAIDFNKDGEVTLEEYHRFDDELGEAFTDGELEKSLKDMDLDGNNVISYDEFLVLASSEIPEEW